MMRAPGRNYGILTVYPRPGRHDFREWRSWCRASNRCWRNCAGLNGNR